MTPLTDNEISALVAKGRWHETLKDGQTYIVAYSHNDVPLGEPNSRHCDQIHLKVERGIVQWMRAVDLLNAVRSGAAPVWHEATD